MPPTTPFETILSLLVSLQEIKALTSESTVLLRDMAKSSEVHSLCLQLHEEVLGDRRVHIEETRADLETMLTLARYAVEEVEGREAVGARGNEHAHGREDDSTQDETLSNLFRAILLLLNTFHSCSDELATTITRVQTRFLSGLDRVSKSISFISAKIVDVEIMKKIEADALDGVEKDRGMAQERLTRDVLDLVLGWEWERRKRAWSGE